MSSETLPGDRLIWSSKKNREKQWELAKKYFKENPNEPKLCRKDTWWSQEGQLDSAEHSFYKYNGKIYACAGSTKHLGSGAYGQVKLLEDEKQERAAIKLYSSENTAYVLEEALHEQNIAYLSGAAPSNSVIERNSTSAKLPKSANGKKYYGVQWYLGKTLSKHIDNNLHMSFEDRLALAISASRSVESFHKKGFAHQDLKPANMTVDENRQVHLIDFGFATQLQGGRKINYNLGTYVYLPHTNCCEKYNPQLRDTFALLRILYFPTSFSAMQEISGVLKLLRSRSFGFPSIFRRDDIHADSTSLLHQLLLPATSQATIKPDLTASKVVNTLLGIHYKLTSADIEDLNRRPTFRGLILYLYDNHRSNKKIDGILNRIIQNKTVVHLLTLQWVAQSTGSIEKIVNLIENISKLSEAQIASIRQDITFEQLERRIELFNSHGDKVFLLDEICLMLFQYGNYRLYCHEEDLLLAKSSEFLENMLKYPDEISSPEKCMLLCELSGNQIDVFNRLLPLGMAHLEDLKNTDIDRIPKKLELIARLAKSSNELGLRLNDTILSKLYKSSDTLQNAITAGLDHFCGSNAGYQGKEQSKHYLQNLLNSTHDEVDAIKKETQRWVRGYWLSGIKFWASSGSNTTKTGSRYALARANGLIEGSEERQGSSNASMSKSFMFSALTKGNSV